jgi:hypothetical protein
MAFVPNMMTLDATSEAPMPDKEWQERTKNLLKAELTRRGVSYKQLADKLSEIGIKDTEANIKNKISRGGFTAVFLVQCMEAIGAKSIRLQED